MQVDIYVKKMYYNAEFVLFFYSDANLKKEAAQLQSFPWPN